jgi:type IV secretory pathway VirB4 component
LIVGRTRTGKSITTNWLMSDILARGGTVFILDRYGSYHGLAALYGGVVKRVSPTEPVCLGLMDGPLDADHRSAVVGVMAELFVAQGDPPLGATDIAYLTALVQGFAQHWHVEYPAATATLSNFLGHLETTPLSGGAGRFARRLGVVLSLYAGTGEYAAFLDGPNELVMGHGLSILDIDGLDDVSWLQTIITLLFFHRAEAYIQDPAHLKRRKLLVSDECWGMLKSAQAAEAINKYVRAYARFNAALVMITQNMTDLESLVGRVLINNSGRALMFKLLSDEARYVCEQLGMPAHMVEVIASLVGPDEYQHADMAEGIVCRPNDAGGDGGLFRLVAPQAWLARVGQSRQHQEAS